MKVWILGPDKRLVESLALGLEQRLGEPVYIIVSLSIMSDRLELGSWSVYRHPSRDNKVIEEWKDITGDGKEMIFPILVNSAPPENEVWGQYDHYSGDTHKYIRSKVGALHGIDCNERSVDELVDILERDIRQHTGHKEHMAA